MIMVVLLWLANNLMASNGDRNYLVHDPEGHEWYFGTHVREMSEDEMQSAGVATS